MDKSLAYRAALFLTRRPWLSTHLVLNASYLACLDSGASGKLRNAKD
jgi:hypothetical protein